MTQSDLWWAVAVIALVTALTRFLPFVLFRDEQKVPALVRKLGTVLPYAVMGMLVVYCLKDIQITQVSSVVPAVSACVVVIASYLWKRNTLISIAGGTVCYMLLVQLAF